MLYGAVADGMDGDGAGGGAALVSHVVGSSKRSGLAAVNRWQTAPVCDGGQGSRAWWCRQLVLGACGWRAEAAGSDETSRANAERAPGGRG